MPRTITTIMNDEEYVHLLWAARNAGRDHFLRVGYRDAPLSGEWAGESIPELSVRYDISFFNAELAVAFEIGFFSQAEL